MGKTIYAKCMFMILLIIAMPFYGSIVYADNNLEVKQNSGDAGVNGYFDGYDRWILKTLSSVDGDEMITVNQVRVNDYPMQNCTQSAPGVYECSFMSEYYSLDPGSYPSTVKLYTDNAVPVREISFNMTMDRLAPLIFFDRKPVQNGDVVIVAYTLKDRAWEEDNFNVCSGLDKVEFWDDAVKLAEQNITAPGCIYQAETNVPRPSSGKIIIRAYDKMGHIASLSSQRFDIDVSKPVIETDTFKIFTQGVELQQYIPSSAFEGSIQIRILEDGSLSTSKVFANLVPFGQGSAVPAINCVLLGGIEYSCTWPTLTLSIPSGTSEIKFNATDDSGNVGKATVIRSSIIDTTAPNIISVGTRNMWNSISYIGSIPQDIVAIVNDAGAGMSGRQALIDINEVDSGYSGKYFQANRCEKAGANWECIWTDVKSSRAHGTRGNIYIIKLFDDAGNEATGVKQGSLFIDQIAPEVKPISTGVYANITPITQLKSWAISSGDDIIVTVNVKDDSEVKGYADFSGIMGAFGYENVSAECDTSDNINWVCKWEVGPVGSGYLREDVSFTFIDSALNSKTVKQKFEVFAKSFEENPDYWTSKVKGSMPNALDRATTALISHKMYFEVELKTSTSAELVSSDLVSCGGEGAGYLEDAFILNNQRGSKKVYIGLRFKPFDATMDTLNVNCTLNLLSIYNKKLMTNYEKENVPLVVRFYDMPLGEASDKIKDEIEDEYDKWVGPGWARTIGMLEQIFEYSRKICNVYYVYRSTIYLIDLVKQAVGAAEDTSPPAKAALAPTRKGICAEEEGVRESTNKLSKFFDKYCGFINCKLGPLPPGEKKEGLEAWTTFFGGGNRNVVSNFFSEQLAGGFGGVSWLSGKSGLQTSDPDVTKATPSGYMNVKENYVLSLATLCIPGIIYNANKLRGIHCSYISCLSNAVDTGTSIDTCKGIKSYQECRYIYGPLLQLIPFAAFFDYILNIVKNAISDPLALLGTGISATCAFACPAPTSHLHTVCAWTKIFSQLGDIISNVEGIFEEDAWTLTDPCIELEGKDVEDLY